MIRVAWICPNSTERERVLGAMEQPGAASVVAVLQNYCLEGTDAESLRLKVARPDVVVVDLEDRETAFQCLRFLGTLLPGVSLFAIGGEDSALIIEAMRNGVREYIRRSVLDELVAALKRAQKEIRASRESSGRECRVFTVVGAKGGVGTTTVALNLADALSHQPEVRVALLDLGEPVGDIAAHLDLKPKFTIENVVAAGDRLDADLLDSFTVAVDNFWLLAGRSRMGYGDAPSADNINNLLTVIRQLYDYVVVDLSSAVERPEAETVFGLSDQIAVIFTAELPALWRAVRVFDYMSRLGVRHNALAILNRWRRNDSLTNSEIESGLRTKLYWSLPNDYSAVTLAVRRGHAAVASGRGGLASSFQDLAKKLVGGEQGKREGGVLSLLR